MVKRSQPIGAAQEYSIAVPADAYWNRDNRIHLGDDLTRALTPAMEHLRRSAAGSLTFVAAPADGWGCDDRTIVYRVRDGVALAISGGALQDQVRAALDGGDVEGWSHLPSEESAIPLAEAQSRLGVRVYNHLARQGFETLDQVLAVPEDALRQERGVGRLFIETLRRLRDAEEPLVRVVHTRPVRKQNDHIELVRKRMSGVTLRRYGALVRPLGQCDLPESALNAIVDSLNSEALPPADAAVIRLLQDAGEPDLLEAYLHTHQAPAPEPATR